MIKSQLKHSAVVSGLCEDTLLSFHSCVQLAEQTAESGAQVNPLWPRFTQELAVPLAIAVSRFCLDWFM